MTKLLREQSQKSMKNVPRRDTERRTNGDLHAKTSQSPALSHPKYDFLLEACRLNRLEMIRSKHGTYNERELSSVQDKYGNTPLY